MKDHIKAHSIANGIRMNRSHPRGHRGAFIVLEGDADRRLFCKLLSATACKLVVAWTRQDALLVLGLLEQTGFRGALAIVDADLTRVDPLLDPVHQSANVMLTDGHDIECMMVASQALTSLLIEFGSEDKIAACKAQDATAERLEQALRLAYGQKDFIRTGLFASLQVWQAAHPDFPIL
jgi:hypothetical protein